VSGKLGKTELLNSRTLKKIRSFAYYKTVFDNLERAYRYTKEKIFGLDYSVFDKTILYYKEVKGKTITKEEALSIALDKKRHKDAWFIKPRNTVEDFFRFYQEVDVYPFRQPYVKRFGGFKWYVRLVGHIDKPSILEYGCGSAVLTEWLIERYQNLKYTVADIPSVTLEFVKWKKTKFKYGYSILTIRPGKDGIPLTEEYDLIICQDVLEHTPNPLDIVSSFIKHLSHGGILITDFLNSPGGENLQCAAEQREKVKDLLKKNLIALKPIDEPKGVNGLYVKD
jgi:2-polyprenyl-3-methyl-5-hydroxy-6-metoxy-1,4-benzoquinol methylase